MIKRILLLLSLAIAVGSLPGVGRADEQEKVIRLGMIGLDTSHVIAFTRYLNDRKNKTGCRVVAGFPGGSPDFPASANRVDKFTKQLREQFGLEIVDSIEPLFTVMGTGCETVRRIKADRVDMVVGIWKGGRIGTFRDLLGGKTDFKTIIYGKNGMATGKSSGYAPLLDQIVKSFKTGKPPVHQQKQSKLRS